MYLTNSLELLKSIINVIVFILQYALLPIGIYHLIISMFGWVKRKEVDAGSFAPVNRFAILVAAHNEENVIGNIVRNLKQLNYPSDMYDIFVIADNCTDSTARVAMENGAQVFERLDNVKKGKGFALEWMFKKIFDMNNKYDAIGVFDADNLASPNFLREMNKQLCRGYKVVQGYLDSKNPSDSLVAGSYAITYWINNRLFQLPRYYLGLCCAIGGTGFVVATNVLKEIGWGATCLTEDLEFTLKLVLKGQKVYWSHEAVVYDEKPITLAQSWRQRTRWMQGQSDCACRYLKHLLKMAFKEKNMVAFDCALYLIQPLIIIISGIGIFANILRFILFTNFSRLFSSDILMPLLLLFITTYISFVFIVMEGKFSVKTARYFLAFPFYNLTWIPIIIQGFRNKDQKEWDHTIHTRGLDIADVQKLDKAG